MLVVTPNVSGTLLLLVLPVAKLHLVVSCEFISRVLVPLVMTNFRLSCGQFLLENVGSRELSIPLLSDINGSNDRLLVHNPRNGSFPSVTDRVEKFF